MTHEILKQLTQIEQDHNVRIIHAVESGSRAWGFPSEDSDYDVRFIYHRTEADYLSIFKRRDVIEIPIDETLDISGWDLDKTLRLMRSNNPSLAEWLTSDIIYRSHAPAFEQLCDLAQRAFHPTPAAHHYLSMSKSTLAKITDAPQAKIKTYLYSLRPLLCSRWVLDHNSQPPILFHKLLDTYLPTGDIRDIIDHLLRIKQATNETDRIDRQPALEAYIQNGLDAATTKISTEKSTLPEDDFDQLFQAILRDA